MVVMKSNYFIVIAHLKSSDISHVSSAFQNTWYLLLLTYLLD